MIWNGFTVMHGERKAAIRRAHGNWLAIAYDRRGNPSSAEYFSYGEPGAIVRAKNWCEDRLRERAIRRAR